MITDREPTQYQLLILAGLQHKPVFQGLTEAGWDRVAKRRAKNKVARRQRKLNKRR